MKEKLSLRPRRIFSDAVKKKTVSDIESGKVSVLVKSRELSVSEQSIYCWLNKYSRHLHSSQTVVVQMESEAYKTKELEKRIQELEAALGRKQLEIDFLNTLIEVGKKELGVDLKKKHFTPPFTGSGSTENNMDTK